MSIWLFKVNQNTFSKANNTTTFPIIFYQRLYFYSNCQSQDNQTNNTCEFNKIIGLNIGILFFYYIFNIIILFRFSLIWIATIEWKTGLKIAEYTQGEILEKIHDNIKFKQYMFEKKLSYESRWSLVLDMRNIITTLTFM